MNLLKVLAKDLKEWPDDAHTVGQAVDGTLHLDDAYGYFIRHTLDKYSQPENGVLSYYTDIVTKEAWEKETGRQSSLSGLGKTKEWFEAAVPVPTEASFNVQLGCHLEEISEMLQNLTGETEESEQLVADAEAIVSLLADRLKRGRCFVAVIDPVEHLDALADQIVTAVGCAHMAGMDIVGALDEVNRSNFSKFEDGKPVFNEHGKIKKGRDYQAPELAGFVGVGE